MALADVQARMAALQGAFAAPRAAPAAPAAANRSASPGSFGAALAARLGDGGPPRSDWAAQLPAPGRALAPEIERAAEAAGIDPSIVGAVAWAESGFRPEARSPAGAVGVMQLMPATAASLGVDPRDPGQSLAGGARYLAQQLDRFGRLDLALAAYNAGPSRVAAAGGVPNLPETKSYVQRVLALVNKLRGDAASEA